MDEWRGLCRPLQKWRQKALSVSADTSVLGACLWRMVSGLVLAAFSSWMPVYSLQCLGDELLSSSIAVSAVQAVLISAVVSA